jgi:tetratricopeptide (TPR) repeat protein
MKITPSSISEDEIQQLLRTVEMFEAITQVQQADYQSLEILKEAYNKLGRQEDGLRISKKLIEAYEKQGQIFKAILECEGILQEKPKEATIRQRLSELEAQANMPATQTPTPVLPAGEDKLPPKPATVEPTPISPLSSHSPDDADKALADALVAEKLATPQALQLLLEQLKILRTTSHPKNGPPLTLIQLIVNEQYAKLEDILTALVNRSGLPYLPVGTYDFDRDIACSLPLEFCWQHCLVPFDKIGKCVLIATTNPFDQAARRLVESKLQSNLFWYISPPAEIATTLRRAHQLEAGTKATAKL